MDLKLNQRAYELLNKTAEENELRRLEYSNGSKKATLIDMGVNAKFGQKKAFELGAKIADASMGCLGKTVIKNNVLEVIIPEKPAVAALSCQLAGWEITVGDHKALGSGPARIPAKKPSKIIEKMGYFESPREAALILETDHLPDKDACLKLLEDTKAENLVIAAFKGNTDIGLINILARVAEVGIFRLNNLGFDTKKIISAEGSVPIPLIPVDAMFKGNDAIIYQGKVGLKVDTWDSALTEKAVSSSSPVYGKSFQDIFNAALGDFYRIDANIFSPAEINIVDQKGNKYHSGAARPIY
jgi:methenyltetrahydromethanopterin cyclohydrolase